MLLKILSFVFGMFSGGSGAQKVAGTLNGLTLLGAVSGAVVWLLGPGREWSITLNALELSGVVGVASLLLEYFRRMPPPDGPPPVQRQWRW